MLVGIPKEIKNHEYRIGMTPAGVRELTRHGHKVLVEENAALAIGISNEQYLQAGATLCKTGDEIFDTAELIIKVKEPQPEECRKLHPGQIIFTYLHLAPDPQQTQLLVSSGAIAIAYETVTDNIGRLPLLTPMSEVAGRMSIQAGAHCLEISEGGNGTLLGGVPGVSPGKVVVLGGGIVGENAARMAMGLGADVSILDINLERLKALDTVYGPRLKTLYSTTEILEESVFSADLVIGGVLIPGAAAPKLVTSDMIKKMKKGSVIVDVAIDQGGCFETSHATTHANPTYIVDGVVHYCVANMPGAVARTSTFALTQATLPYVVSVANKGMNALKENKNLRNGLNIHKGEVTCEAVANALGYDYFSPESALGLNAN
jgi:alanine dehydrogenase